MRSAARLVLAVSAATLVAGCAAGGPFGRGRGPDEFAVARNAPSTSRFPRSRPALAAACSRPTR